MFAFGFTFDFNFDLALGYRAIFMWMYRDNIDWFVMNPNIFAELASHNYIAIKLGVFEIRAVVDLTGYKVTPVEYQAMYSLDFDGKYCHSMGFL